MSADLWLDCPCCGEKEEVRVDCTTDIDLYSDGTMTSDMTAYCKICNQVFKFRSKEG